MICIEGFDKVCKSLFQQVTLKGQSQSTLNNYLRSIAIISLRFNCLPDKISEDEINEYLTSLATNSRSPSRSAFKHMVYGLRYYFRNVGKTDLAIKLPSLKKEATLPVILNRSELKALFKAPKLLKHRIILTLIYSAGLRRQEAVNLKIADIDFERKTIHIRQSKYLKDRIVPLSSYMARGLRKYLEVEKPHTYLFNGKEPDGRYSMEGLGWVMHEARKNASITKKRHYGIYSLRFLATIMKRSVRMVVCQQETTADRIKRLIGVDIAFCPRCRNGRLIPAGIIPRSRSPTSSGFKTFPFN